MPVTHKTEVRIYKLIFVMLVLAGAILLTLALRSTSVTLNSNFEQTQCNQGLLVAALTGVKNEYQISFCSPEIQAILEEAF